MEFEPHGTFELTRRGDIIIIRFYHSWNLEGAKAFSSDAEALAWFEKLGLAVS